MDPSWVTWPLEAELRVLSSSLVTVQQYLLTGHSTTVPQYPLTPLSSPHCPLCAPVCPVAWLRGETALSGGGR